MRLIAAMLDQAHVGGYEEWKRAISELWDAISDALPAFNPDECANYFTATGYEGPVTAKLCDLAICISAPGGDFAITDGVPPLVPSAVLGVDLRRNRKQAVHKLVRLGEERPMITIQREYGRTGERGLH